MAKIIAGKGGTFEAGSGWGTQWAEVFHPMENVTETSTKAVFRDDLGNKVTMYGTGLDASHPKNIKGSVERVVIADSHGRLIFDTTNISMDYSTLHERVLHDWQWGITDLMGALMSGNDTIIGTDGSEDLIVALNLGNDTIKAMGGDDFVRGGPGNDNIDGGGGYDTLAYHVNWGGAPQKRGVELDAAAGTAINPWGGKDTIAGFEFYRLSARNDVVRGSSKNETFQGLDGADNVNGRGGFDTMSFLADAFYGGNVGVTANLMTGKSVDGYGKTDTLTSIEALVGTAKSDRLTGNDQHNELTGLSGNDRLTGNGGSDTFIFSLNCDRDEVTDFQANGKQHDIIRLEDYGTIHNFADLKSHMTEVHGNVVIDRGEDDEITLVGVTLNELDKTHFDFN
jgi:Ca2+-binding RTX toxin-like protein